MRSRLASLWRRFVRAEDGAATIEAVLWFPVFIWLMMIVTDASLAFFAKAEAFRIIQNGNRAYSTHRFDEPGDVATWVKAQFGSYSARAVVTSQLVDVGDEEDVLVQTDLSVPITDVVLFNSLAVPESWTIAISAQHYVE